MFDLDLQSRTPIYEQLYKKTVELIIKGVLKENEQLPSVRSLAKDLSVNPNTVSKAYQELERNKIIYSVSGRGSFVSKIVDSSVKDYILSDFDEKASEALKIGISKDELKERIFFINDETIQFTNFTLEELKNYYKSFYPKFSEELFEKLRTTINLPLKKKLNAFSKGMKRQAVVITALACQTDYLLLDEAFDGLDPTMRIIVKRMLVDAMLDRELTTVISSHNLKEINEVCDRVALLHQGKIVFARELDSVKGNIHKIQAVFRAADSSMPQYYSKEELSGTGIEILHFEKNQSVYHIIAKGDVEDIKEKLQPKDPVVLDIIPLSLEEIFIYEMEALGYDFNAIEIDK